MHGSDDRLRRTHARAPGALVATLLAVVLDATSAGQDERGPQSPDGARPGAWSRSETPDGWLVVETRSYQVQSRLDRDTTVALGRHLEDLAELFRELAPAPGADGRLPVKLLADEAEYEAYVAAHGLDEAGGEAAGRPADRYGRFDAATGEVVVWNTRLLLGRSGLTSGVRLDKDRMHTLTYGENEAVLLLLDAATRAYTPDVGAALARHAWRQHLHRSAWDGQVVELPAWLECGLAEHFATAARDDKGRCRTGLNAARIRELSWMLVEGDVVPLSQLLAPAEGAPAFDLGPGPPAQGWALVHFLLGHRERRMQLLVPRLLAELGRGEPAGEALADVFGDVDLPALEAEWLAWARGLGSADPLAELARDYGDKVRPDQLVGDEALRKQYGWLWRRRNGPQPDALGIGER